LQRVVQVVTSVAVGAWYPAEANLGTPPAVPDAISIFAALVLAILACGYRTLAR